MWTFLVPEDRTSPRLEAGKALQAPVWGGQSMDEALAHWKIQCLPASRGLTVALQACPLPSCHQVHGLGPAVPGSGPTKPFLGVLSVATPLRSREPAWEVGHLATLAQEHVCLPVLPIGSLCPLSLRAVLLAGRQDALAAPTSSWAQPAGDSPHGPSAHLRPHLRAEEVVRL